MWYLSGKLCHICKLQFHILINYSIKTIDHISMGLKPSLDIYVSYIFGSLYNIWYNFERNILDEAYKQIAEKNAN